MWSEWTGSGPLGSLEPLFPTCIWCTWSCVNKELFIVIRSLCVSLSCSDVTDSYSK